MSEGTLLAPGSAPPHASRAAGPNAVDTTPDQTHLVPIAKSAAPWTWRLHVVASGDPRWVGRVLRLAAGTWLIGRAPGELPGALQLEDELVSRLHVKIQVRDGAAGLVVEDLASRNGTWANGALVSRAQVGDGAVLRFGHTVGVVEADVGRGAGFEAPTVDVLGHSERARILRDALHRASQTALPVLLCGATGTGKEHAAAELHKRSGKIGQLVRLNTAAVPESLFEAELFGAASGAFTGAQKARSGRIVQANGGTLVLDEIAELPLNLQPKLLRALEEGAVRPLGATVDLKIDVKFVASTNADLDACVQQGRFRADLLARLRSHVVVLPPLAERRADLLQWADVVAPYATTFGRKPWHELLPAAAVEALLLRPWPYNLRDLRATLTELPHQWQDDAALLGWLGKTTARLTVAAQVTQPEVVVPWPMPANASAHPRRRGPSRPELQRMLVDCAGNVEEMARRLGCARRQVYRWMAYVELTDLDLAAARGDLPR